jgi:hypothetical protein
MGKVRPHTRCGTGPMCMYGYIITYYLLIPIKPSFSPSDTDQTKESVASIPLVRHAISPSHENCVDRRVRPNTTLSVCRPPRPSSLPLHQRWPLPPPLSPSDADQTKESVTSIPLVYPSLSKNCTDRRVRPSAMSSALRPPYYNTFLTARHAAHGGRFSRPLPVKFPFK